MRLKIEIPWPPSINKYWLLKRNGSRYLSGFAREFRKDCLERLMRSALVGAFLQGSVSVAIHQFPPDRRCRDIDNVVKPILDAFSHAGVWTDDQQVKTLVLIRGPIVRPWGKCVVSVWRPLFTAC